MDGIRRIELACFSDKGTVRTNNEDNMYFSLYNITNEKSEDSYCATFSDEYGKDLKVVAIFDGMGGTEGGEIIAQGTPKDIMKSKNSITGAYLSGKKRIEVPKTRRKRTRGEDRRIRREDGRYRKHPKSNDGTLV